ncbi:translation initiation factor eIF2B subunit delta-like isoform X2 [Ornithodoros turicata]|uniref:translation initiation factor eIF2B subunit delta-like isoform X2 n=1 Tax=Ornithodoros turicata TaxID=34597 RepID=UPI003139C778
MDTLGQPEAKPKKKRNRHRNRHRRPAEAAPEPEPTPNVTIITKQPNYSIFNANGIPTEFNGVSIFPVPCASSSTQQEPHAEGDSSNKKLTRKRKRKKKNPNEPELPAQNNPVKSKCCNVREQNSRSCFELICPHSSQEPQSGPSSKRTPPSEQNLSHLQNLSESIVKKLASLDSTSISITVVNADDSRPGVKVEEDMPRKSEGAVLEGIKKGQPKVEAKNAQQKKSQNEERGDAKNATQNDKVEDASSKDVDVGAEKTKAQLKAERKAAFEAQRAAQLAAQGGAGKEADAKPEKSKAELRAERRALQEAQRLAKAQPTSTTQAASTAKDGDAKSATTESKLAKQGTNSAEVSALEAKKQPVSKAQTDVAKKVVKRQTNDTAQGDLRILSHLHQNPDVLDHLRVYGLPNSGIHPDVLKAGYRIAEGVLSGSNSRCVAMLLAFRSVIADYCSQSNKRISQDLREQLDSDIEFLKKCRPLCVSMQNAITFLKGHISEIQDSESTHEVKENLTNCIDKFLHEEIYLARKQISESALTKILDDDVILTYSCSSLVQSVLKSSHEKGKRFRVIVVDSRPRLEGLEMLKYLRSLGINCTYTLINAISYIMKEVTKVMLGAHSLLANGYVTSRIGSSQIALVARARNVPVLVCCETYKFSERVHTDSFVSNELGPESHLLRNLPPSVRAEGLKELPSLTILNLTYDITPPEFVDMVITEKGMLPCTSVPVVLRMRNAAVS